LEWGSGTLFQGVTKDYYRVGEASRRAGLYGFAPAPERTGSNLAGFQIHVASSTSYHGILGCGKKLPCLSFWCGHFCNLTILWEMGFVDYNVFTYWQLVMDLQNRCEITDFCLLGTCRLSTPAGKESQMTLAIMITMFTFMLLFNGATKFSCDWTMFCECCEGGDLDGLISMRDGKWRWIMRHFICAVMGVGFVMYVKSAHSLEHFDLLVKLSAVHVVLSLLCAFIESLFITKITSEVASRIEAVKVNSDDN
jgi:hypothetical protein